VALLRFAVWGTMKCGLVGAGTTFLSLTTLNFVWGPQGQAFGWSVLRAPEPSPHVELPLDLTNYGNVHEFE